MDSQQWVRLFQIANLSIYGNEQEIKALNSLTKEKDNRLLNTNWKWWQADAKIKKEFFKGKNA